MKIELFETHHIRLPFQSGGPFGWGRTEWRALDLVLLRVEVEGGLVGWGEAWGFTDAGAARDALEHVVGPAIVGLDASDIEGISHVLQSEHGAPGLGSPAMHAISAVDIALWDIAGKAAGVPLYRLFWWRAAQDDTLLREHLSLRRSRNSGRASRCSQSRRLPPHQVARNR